MLKDIQKKHSELLNLQKSLEMMKVGNEEEFSTSSIKRTNLISSNLEELKKNSSESKRVQEVKDIIRTIFS